MNLNNIDLNKIRVFHTVVKLGSYQSAADELGLTRSAISQSMTTLEAQLGVSLFQRKGRKLFPTKEAKDFSFEFGQYQKALNEVLGRLTNPEGEVEGLIRIGAYFEFAKTQLTSLVKTFSEMYPHAKFKFIFDSPSRLQRALENGQIDMSFSIFPHREANDIESVKIFSQELVLVSPKAYAKKAENFDELLKLPLIEYYSSHLLLPRWMQRHFSKRVRKLDVKVFAASAEMLLEFVANDVGVGVVPTYLYESSEYRGLKIIRPTEKKLKDHIWLNQFAGQFENSAHRAFYEFVKKKMDRS